MFDAWDCIRTPVLKSTRARVARGGQRPRPAGRTMAPVGKLLVVLVLTGVVGLGVAFLYQPRRPESRLARIGWRIRIVGYAYVAALIISAALRLAGWGL